MDLKQYIASVPNFPQEGIMFRDITPLLQDKNAFKYTIDALAEEARRLGADVICGPESRGFIFGCPVANEINVGFIPIRKPHKLPRKTIEVSYTLEYGSNTLCMHEDAIKPGQKVVIIDDLLATGGTIKAACKLIEQLGGEVVGCLFVIELVDLKGRQLLKDYHLKALMEYEGE